MQNKIVVLQDSEQAIANLITVIEDTPGFEIVGTSIDGETGLKLIEKYKPDYVIASIVLKSIDGFGVMEKVSSISPKTEIIVVSSFTSESIITRALNSGALYYIAKPFKSDIIKNRLIELSSKVEAKEISNGIEKRKSTLDEKISKIFISVGIPPHIKGYSYLREGVKMAVETPEIINTIEEFEKE